MADPSACSWRKTADGNAPYALQRIESCAWRNGNCFEPSRRLFGTGSTTLTRLAASPPVSPRCAVGLRCFMRQQLYHISLDARESFWTADSRCAFPRDLEEPTLVVVGCLKAERRAPQPLELPSVIGSEYLHPFLENPDAAHDEGLWKRVAQMPRFSALPRVWEWFLTLKLLNRRR